MEKYVIVEYCLKLPGDKICWLAAEVRYKVDDDKIYYGKPEVLTVKNEEVKICLEGLLVGLIGCKGEFFMQTNKAIWANEKRANKGKK